MICLTRWGRRWACRSCLNICYHAVFQLLRIRLYENLDEKLNSQFQVGILLPLCKLIPYVLVIQSNCSKIVIASNLWTSKNSVYAFAGTVAFWIDDNWNLDECVLELLLLDGDHSGKASGKLIFKSLHRQGIKT
jgi:hypothetical protein